MLGRETRTAFSSAKAAENSEPFNTWYNRFKAQTYAERNPSRVLASDQMSPSLVPGVAGRIYAPPESQVPHLNESSPTMATIAPILAPPPLPPPFVVPLGTPQLPYEATLPTPQGRAAFREFLESSRRMAAQKMAAQKEVSVNGNHQIAGIRQDASAGRIREESAQHPQASPIYGITNVSREDSVATATAGVVPSNVRVESLVPLLVHAHQRRRKEDRDGHDSQRLDSNVMRLAREMTSSEHALLREKQYFDAYGWGGVAQIGLGARASSDAKKTATGARFPKQQPALSKEAFREACTELFNREATVRSGIHVAEEKHRHFIVTHSPAFVGPNAVQKRTERTATQYKTAVAILTQYRQQLHRLEGEEELRRKGIADSFAAWADLMKIREEADRAAIVSRLSSAAEVVAGAGFRYDMNKGVFLPLLLEGPLRALEDAEERGRCALLKAEGAARNVLGQRAYQLRSFVASNLQRVLRLDEAADVDGLLESLSVAGGVFPRQRVPSTRTPPSSAGSEKRASLRLNRDLSLFAEISKKLALEWRARLVDFEAVEARARLAIENAELNFRTSVAMSFDMIISAARDRQDAMVTAFYQRNSLASRLANFKRIEEEEHADRNNIIKASNAWLEGIATRYNALTAQSREFVVFRARLVQDARDRLPTLKSVESEEAARRQYLHRTYDDWCEQTLGLVQKRLAGHHELLVHSTRVVRQGLSAIVAAVVKEEEKGRGGIEAGEHEWRRHIYESEIRSRLVGVYEKVAEKQQAFIESPTFRTSLENAATLADLEAEEASKRSALETAEWQWTRFIFGACGLNVSSVKTTRTSSGDGSPRVAEGTIKGVVVSRPVPSAASGSAAAHARPRTYGSSVPWDVDYSDPINSIRPPRRDDSAPITSSLSSPPPIPREVEEGTKIKAKTTAPRASSCGLMRSPSGRTASSGRTRMPPLAKSRGPSLPGESVAISRGGPWYDESMGDPAAYDARIISRGPSTHYGRPVVSAARNVNPLLDETALSNQNNNRGGGPYSSLHGDPKGTVNHERASLFPPRAPPASYTPL